MPESGPSDSTPESLFHKTEINETRTETVLFLEDGDVATQSSEALTMDSKYFTGVSDSLENSVKGFLSRPVLIKNFEWLSSALPMADVTPGNTFPNDWLARPMIKNKIDGFTFFRGTLVLRVQLNNQPFTAGRLIIWFNPFGFQEAHNPSSIEYLGGITGYRHVDLDIGEVTSAELRVPFMCPLTHISLINNTGNMGSLRYTVYSQLRGSTSIEGAIWAHFEDIDIQMPTGHPLANFTLQSGSLDKEKEMGDVENLFRAQKRITKRLGDVPVIGFLAEPVSWFLDQAAGFAGMFGFSKPTNPDFPTAVNPQYLQTYANFNGKTLSKPLGFDARNATRLPSGIVGTNADEMSLAHVTQQPIFAQNFLFSVGQAPGTILLKWPVHPASCRKNTVSSVVTWDNTYLSYLCQLFEWWRGTICYSFKVVKTPFHSGRIRVVFVPGADLNTDFATVDQDKCYTKIVDLRDCNSFDFSVPFVSNALWMPIRHDVSTINPSELLSDTPTGMFYIEVLNSLRVGGAAANDIEILMETFAGHDFQFAFLTRKVDLDIDIPGSLNTFTLQAGVGQTNTSPEPLFSGPELGGYLPNLASMGEAITSLRQILKRYTKVAVTSMPTPAVGKCNVIRPYITEQHASAVKDLFSYVSQLYRIQSGGMKLLLTADAGVSPAVISYSLEPYDEFGTVASNIYEEIDGAPDTNHGAPGGIFYPGFENTLELDIPFYQPYPFIPTANGKMTISTDIGGITEKCVPFNLGPQLRINNTIPLSVHRIIGEDFSFGYLIGPPRLTYTIPPDPPEPEE